MRRQAVPYASRYRRTSLADQLVELLAAVLFVLLTIFFFVCAVVGFGVLFGNMSHP